MISIRNSVFETNSSSTHSLSIKRNTTGKYDRNLHITKNGNIVLFNMDKFDFDWGYAEYCDAYAKLNYLACMAFQCYQEVMGEKGIRKISDINKIPDIKKLYNFCKKYFSEFKGFTFLKKNLYINDKELISFYFAYGIDHQSYEDFKSMSDFLKCNHISIENFVFNPNVVLVIDNDNK